MKYKILLFIIICILLKNIYNINKPKINNVLYIGEYTNIDSINYNKISNKYYIDSMTLDKLKELIYNNDYRIIKDKKYYLNQYISSSNIIYININNRKKCNKKTQITIEKEEEIINIIKKMTNSKVYFINLSCNY